ncbi:hypothetical protein V1511DRAFT_494422 [Dipodascopsis uninucleata]
MVCLLNRLSAHRMPVLALYRALLRHNGKLSRIANTGFSHSNAYQEHSKFSYDDSQLMLDTIKARFKLNKKLPNIQRVKLILEDAYILEKLMRQAACDLDIACLNELHDRCELRRHQILRTNFKYSRNKGLTPELQEIQRQNAKESNIILRYAPSIRYEHQDIPDEEVRDLALKKHVLRKKRTRKLKNKYYAENPRLPRIGYIQGVYRMAFIRMPGKQNPRLSMVISKRIKNGQRIIDYLQSSEQRLFHASIEDRWEAILLHSYSTQDAQIFLRGQEPKWIDEHNRDIERIKQKLDVQRKRAMSMKDILAKKLDWYKLEIMRRSRRNREIFSFTAEELESEI